MTAHLPRWCRVTLLTLGLATSVAAAGETAPAPAPAAPPTFLALARVTEVKDAEHVVIGRGRAEGVKRGARGTLYPVRPRKEGEEPKPDFDLVLAQGTFVAVEEHTATVALSERLSAVQVGDTTTYRVDVPPGWVEDPLFEVAANDTVLETMEHVPLYEFAALYADREARSREAVLAAMVKDLRDCAATAGATYTKRIEGGRFHGKSLGEVLAATTREEVLQYLDYARTYGGSYSNQRMRLAETYATWIVNGAPTVERERAQKKAKARSDEGDAAAARGDFGAAEEAYRAAMALLPDDEALRTALDRVVNIRLRGARLAKDPDDTATRWELALDLYRSDAFDLALAELARLEKAGYDPDQCAKYRGYAYVRQSRFAEGAALLRKLVEHFKDPALDGWIRYAEARARLLKEPDAFDARLAVAEVHEEDENWSPAADAYREAGAVAKTPEEVHKAEAGQERIGVLKRIRFLTDVVKDSIREHRFDDDLTNRVTEVIELCKKLPEPRKVLLPRISELAEQARQYWELDFGLVLFKGRTEIDPDNAAAWREYAYALQNAGQFAEARPAVDRALTLEPKSAYGVAIRARLALVAGDLAAAARDADAAAALDPGYAWPRELGMMAAAARGDWERARKLAEEALDLDPNLTDGALHVVATAIGRRAAAEIKAGREVPRNRLRLVRALVFIDDYREAQREAARLQGTPYWSDAQWAVAEYPNTLMTTAEQLAAMEAAGATTPVRRSRQEVLLARQAQEKAPAEGAPRVRLAKALVAHGEFHRALAALGSLAWTGADREASDVAQAARRGNQAYEFTQSAAQAARREDRASAAELYRRARAIYVEIGARQEALEAQISYALQTLTMPRKERFELLDALRREAQEWGSRGSYHTVDILIGQLRSEEGTLDDLAAAHRASLEFAREADNPTSECATLQTLSYLAADRGQMREAVALAQKMLDLAREIGSKLQERFALFALGDHQYGSDNLDLAQKLGEELLTKSRVARDTMNERQALVLLGAIALRHGDAKGGLPRLDEMYELGRRAGSSSDRALARLFQGRMLLYVAGDPKGAEERFAQSAEIYAGLLDSWNEARAWLGQGEARLARGDGPGAREVLGRARERYVTLGRRGDEGNVLIELAHAELLSGRKDEALAAARRAVEIAESMEFVETRWQARYAEGRALEARGALDEAAASYDVAVKLLAEEMGKTSTDADRDSWLAVGRRRQVFRDAVDLLIRLGKADRAMEIAQLSRDAQTRARLAPGAVQAQNPALQQTLDGVGDAESRAKAARKALQDEMSKPAGERNDAKVQALSEVAAKSEGELRQLLLRLKRDNRRLYAMLAFSPESVGELRDALPEDVVVVQYFVTEDATYIFTLRRDRAKTRALKVPVKAADLGDAVFEFVGALKAELPRAPKLGAQLYDWLIAPVADEMAAARTTLLVPFGCLHYLPVHALGTERKDGTVSYAIERFRIGYLSSTTLFKLRQAERQHAPGALLAFANPDGSLPGARSEVERVVKQGYGEAKVLYEGDAKKARFFELAGGYRILHFATHGIVTPDPAASHLKMSDAQLTVNEIMGFEGLEGKTDLVVLSACQTAMEKGQATEDEPISIASAFATAGAPALVASLWSVNDQATSELMSRFYDGLNKRAGDVDTLEALRRAQLGVMSMELNGGRPFESPKYWAAFELVGDYR